MTWTEITRRQYQREGLRYSSDVMDAEWEVIVPFLPERRRLGRPRTTDLREVVNAILYVDATGCQWRALPKDFPPRSTIQGYFYAWRDEGIWRQINLALVAEARCMEERNAAPSAAIIDSQSVKTTESGGPRGFDAAKKVMGRKRHIIVDTIGLLLVLLVHPANIQDCHGAIPLLNQLAKTFPKVRHIFADYGYRSNQIAKLLRNGKRTIEIVKRPDGMHGFQVLPRRWVVERSLAWFGRNRRLAKDFEATIASAEAWVLIASIRLLSRRLARA